MSDLTCLPAIDIRDGKCVRLIQGNFAEETIYGDPKDQARRYIDDGAQWLHLVDLDAARSGTSQNRKLIAEIIGLSDVKVQIGGGIRDESAAQYYLEAGARRVIVGTAGLEQPELVESLVEHFPHCIGLGLDHRSVVVDGVKRREVAVRGWESSSGKTLDETVARFETIGIDAIIVTDIERDGMLSGPDLDGYEELLRGGAANLIASGGVSNLDDLRALASLRVDGAYLEGVVVGKALLSGAMTLQEAMLACAR